MKMTSDNFAPIRRSLQICVALTVLGTAAVFAARRLATDAEIANHQALALREDLRAQLSRVLAEETEIHERLGRYREIQTRGIVGRERRLDWVERISQIGSARRLGDIQYELSPQMPAPLPGDNTAAGYEFMASTMKLQMPLLHEDDLLGFLADLGEGVPAFPRVRACDVERVANAGVQLRAACTIDWITLREKT